MNIVVMTEKGFGCLGIIDDKGALAGIITDGDLRHMADDLLTKTASDIMTAKPQLIGGETIDALQLDAGEQNPVSVCLRTGTAD